MRAGASVIAVYAAKRGSWRLSRGKASIMLNKRCIQARQYGMEVLDFWIRGETARVERRKLRESVAGCSQRLHDLGFMAPPFPGVEQGEEFDQ